MNEAPSLESLESLKHGLEKNQTFLHHGELVRQLQILRKKNEKLYARAQLAEKKLAKLESTPPKPIQPPTPSKMSKAVMKLMGAQFYP